MIRSDGQSDLVGPGACDDLKTKSGKQEQKSKSALSLARSRGGHW